MKIIGFDDVAGLNLSPRTCYQWVSEMILRKKETFLPAKTHMAMPGNVFCNVMPCLVYDSKMPVGGVKIVSRYPERKPALDSQMILFNAESGEFLALFDANWITAMRTGAVVAHSATNFARSNFTTLAMIGLGNTARASMLVLADVIDRPLTVKLLRYKDQAELFVERFKDYKNLTFEIVDSMEECIRESDVIVSCATYFESDVADDSWFKEGVLVIPVHTRGFTNCDLFFDKVFADDTGHVDHFRYFNQFKYFSEVCDVVNGRSVGRENDKERILAYNIGIAIHDVYYASHIYEMLKSDPARFDALPDINMNAPTEKFWL